MASLEQDAARVGDPRKSRGRRRSHAPGAPAGPVHAAARFDGLEATATALGRALSTREVAEIAVREGLARLGAGRGVVAVLDPDGHTVRTLAAIGFSHDVVAGWPTFDIDDDAPLSEAMRLREPITIDTPAEIRARYPRYGQVPLDGGPAIVVPLLYADRAVGGLYFRYATEAEPQADRSYLLALGRQCASALERARLHDASARAWADATLLNTRMTFLARVGEVLGEGGGNDAALSRVAALAVPDISDWAMA
ncbi:MAG: GAF domain-containing protein, partial [Solirubrobacteraceae bacterium]